MHAIVHVSVLVLRVFVHVSLNRFAVNVDDLGADRSFGNNSAPECGRPSAEYPSAILDGLTSQHNTSSKSLAQELRSQDSSSLQASSFVNWNYS